MVIHNRTTLRCLRLFGHQDWIRYGVRDRVLRRFCRPEAAPSHDFEVGFYGLRYQGNLRSYLDWVVYFYGAYAKQELLLLGDLLKDKTDPVCLDIGANVGQHSLFLSRYCKEVHAFEPYHPVRMQLQDKISRNRIRNVMVHDVGIGERNGELDFYAPAGANTGTGSFVPSHAVDNNRWIGRLRVVNGDEYLSRRELERIDLIKIDVEGFEKSVLRGLCTTLRKCRPVVVMEFSEDTRHSFSGEDELMSMLPERYRVKHITSNKAFAVFFNKAKYECTDFNFSTSRGNLLLAPQERGAMGGP